MNTNQASKSKKNINYILFIIFAAFAYLQLNDPDGVLWFVIYLSVALICLLNNFTNIPRLIILIVSISLLIYSAFHFSLFIEYLQTDNKEELFGEMVYEKPYLEGTREFIGLLMAAFAVIFQLKKQ
ncbi:transmembrane 220 family protein [Sabulilitoribacter arenilitoris]|uniref:Transmembrane 220 family protein n=1 Tax=Wocania arenilitoris TaxID=2044858 RepID=A0AAE3EP37_9FLAO|nr:transmembrane 220 family protein [Wocania arenilitoris]MCF7569023.1 transmembrane 220 family protein [Wocania arenilitoris]